MDAAEAAHLYCQMMVAIKQRLLALEAMPILDHRGEVQPPQLYELEAAMLSLRKVLELIAFSSLVANQELMRSAIEDLGKFRRPTEMLARIEKLNPHFFPVPARLSRVVGNWCEFYTLAEDVWFQRSQFAGLYAACNHFAHVTNPFSDRKPDLGQSPRRWIRQIRKLLKVHLVTLIGGEVGIVVMNGWEYGSVTFHHAGPIGKQLAEWGRAR